MKLLFKKLLGIFVPFMLLASGPVHAGKFDGITIRVLSRPGPVISGAVDMRGKKFTELTTMGVTRISSIPSDFKLSDSQLTTATAIRTKSPQIDTAEIRLALDSLEWPIGYLDFETLKTAVPLYPDIAPHEQLVTQYSLHVEATPGGEVVHRDQVLPGGPGVVGDDSHGHVVFGVGALIGFSGERTGEGGHGSAGFHLMIDFLNQLLAYGRDMFKEMLSRVLLPCAPGEHDDAACKGSPESPEAKPCCLPSTIKGNEGKQYVRDNEEKRGLGKAPGQGC